MSLLTQAQKSEFIFRENGNLEVRDAVIVWKNFEGRENKFGSRKKTFNLVLDEEMGDKLREEGWNIKFREGREPGDDPLITTEIIVNMDHDDERYNPTVKLYSSFGGRRSCRALDKCTVADLDQLELERVDLVIHPYEHGRMNSVGATVKGYLNELNAVQAQDRSFGGFYANYMDETPDEVPFN